jgi:alkylation response protein AidB-like acyl-CoA dehydrogenase
MGGAALAVGLARAITDFAIPYAKERMAFGEPIAKKQAIAFMLADMHTEVESMRWMVWKAASQLENGLDATRSATLARDYVRRQGMRIADDGLQVFGGHGYIRDYPVEMWFRNMRALTVMEGPVAL